MERSRLRTLLGAGLLILGVCMLARALVFAPMFRGSAFGGNVWAPITEGEAVPEARRIEVEVGETEREQALREGLPIPPAPPIAPLPPLPPAPPAPAAWRWGGWFNPTLIVLALLVLLIWHRGRTAGTPQQA